MEKFKVDFYKKEDFYLPEHQEIYDAMAALHRDRKPVDLTTVDAELARLVRERRVTRETALLYAANPETLAKRI